VLSVYGPAMERLGRFEHYRFLGDKRRQVVHDIDYVPDDHVGAIAELVEAEAFTCFGPDTLPEARNRCYRLCRTCRRARERRGLTAVNLRAS
jgi:hypothetical protein